MVTNIMTKASSRIRATLAWARSDIGSLLWYMALSLVANFSVCFQMVRANLEPSHSSAVLTTTMVTCSAMLFRFIFSGASSAVNGSGEIDHPTAVEAPTTVADAGEVAHV